MLDKKTKIIATIGPASDNPEIISKMLAKGLDIARINMAHCKKESDFKSVIGTIRNESNRLKRHIGILMDLAGPKIRVDLDKIKASELIIEKNREYSLGYSSNNDIPINMNLKFQNESKNNSFIKVDDGKILFKILEIKGNSIALKAMNNSILKNNKGVNFPGISLDIDSVTDNDIKNINLALKYDIDLLALSFVRYSTDINPILKEFKIKNKTIPVIAKIEKPEGIENLDSILETFDGVLIARGDLGVELPLSKLPVLQKTIIEKCRKNNKEVIVATQMLESMIDNPQPTRAEVNDVATAVYESADAVMLSGETSIGKYPVDSVNIMKNIIIETEKETLKGKSNFNKSDELTSNIRFAIGASVKVISKYLTVDAIVVMTESGSTARIVSHYRPNKKIFALTPHKHTCNKLSMVWGVYPILTEKFKSTDEMIEKTEKLLLREKLLSKGDTFVLTSGAPVGVSGNTNMLTIHKIT